MPTITSVKGRLIFNSRGSKSIEVDVITDDKFWGRACAPSGASVGSHEVSSFVNNDPNMSLEVFHKHSGKFIGIDSSNPESVYKILKSIDGSDSYSLLGGSVAYAISMAAVDSASKSLDIPLFKLLKPNGPYRFPFPLGNIIGGGAHAGPGTPDIQEILSCPIGAKSIMEALELNFNLHKEVRKILEETDSEFTYGRGDEGAWAPHVNNDEAISTVSKAIERLGLELGKDVALGIDFASSSFWDHKNKKYNYSRQNIIRNTDQQINYVNELIQNFKVLYVEDPVNEEDFESMASITKNNNNCIVTGDDMLVTNEDRVKIASRYGACTGAILKVNQAGTLYDALRFVSECNKNKLNIITSHRSGESIDSQIAHVAISTSSKMIKTGIIGGERVAKLNELLRVSEYDLIEGMAELSST
jgi:enolase